MYTFTIQFTLVCVCVCVCVCEIRGDVYLYRLRPALEGSDVLRCVAEICLESFIHHFLHMLICAVTFWCALNRGRVFRVLQSYTVCRMRSLWSLWSW